MAAPVNTVELESDLDINVPCDEFQTEIDEAEALQDLDTCLESDDDCLLVFCDAQTDKGGEVSSAQSSCELSLISGGSSSIAADPVVQTIPVTAHTKGQQRKVKRIELKEKDTHKREA